MNKFRLSVSWISFFIDFSRQNTLCYFTEVNAYETTSDTRNY